MATPLLILASVSPRYYDLAYWRTGELCGKVGTYPIQGHGAVFVERVEGSYSGVMGLPLFETAQLLAAAGIKTM